MFDCFLRQSFQAHAFQHDHSLLKFTSALFTNLLAVEALYQFFLHPHFSLAIINREIWKVFGKVYFVERKYSVIRHTLSFEQISIDQVYFLVKMVCLISE